MLPYQSNLRCNWPVWAVTPNLFTHYELFFGTIRADEHEKLIYLVSKRLQNPSMIRIILMRVLWVPLIALFLAAIGYIVVSGFEGDRRSTMSTLALPTTSG